MRTAVFDSSAILTILNSEPGSEKLSSLYDSISSSVNLAEVQTKLVARGLDPAVAWEATLGAVSEASDFTVAHAEIAGTLVSQTRSLGLSLGDRACLALAISLSAPVYTADRAWKSLKLPVRIHVIR